MYPAIHKAIDFSVCRSAIRQLGLIQSRCRGPWHYRILGKEGARPTMFLSSEVISDSIVRHWSISGKGRLVVDPRRELAGYFPRRGFLSALRLPILVPVRYRVILFLSFCCLQNVYSSKRGAPLSRAKLYLP